MTIYKEVKGENGVLRIRYDSYCDSPRDWDNLTKMVCFHRRYNLGDAHNYNTDDYSDWEDMRANIIRKEDVAVILPLYMYDHSGATISTSPFSCSWDSGQIGFVFVTKESIRKEYGIKRVTSRYKEKAENVLQSEVRIYDQYIRGEVYRFTLEDDEGNIIDACSGFYNVKDIDCYLPDEYKHLLKEAI